MNCSETRKRSEKSESEVDSSVCVECSQTHSESDVYVINEKYFANLAIEIPQIHNNKRRKTILKANNVFANSKQKNKIKNIVDIINCL